MSAAHQSMTALALVAQPTRQSILRLVWGRERSAGDIAARVDVTFGAVSQHLRLLTEAGLVERRKRGRSRLYRARREALGPLAAMLEAMWSARLGRLKVMAEEAERQAEPNEGGP
jgi:DNA-binding transcriptional ArsR family regulator